VQVEDLVDEDIFPAEHCWQVLALPRENVPASHAEHMDALLGENIPGQQM
jgi:hypothetical protein